MALALLAGCMPPSWGADLLLHPRRRAPQARLEGGFEPLEITGASGVELRGWRKRAEGRRRGTLVYLHGVGDNSDSGLSVARRFAPRGLDVIAYDSRAHGASGGDSCTYGYYEKRDLARVIDHAGPGPVVLFGVSMGAAVALQAAGFDPRVSAVVSVATISDLRTAVAERAPFFASRANIEEALHLAEARAAFRVDEVSPVAAAPSVQAPVLLVHGERDTETPPAHTWRVYKALLSSKKIVIVPGAGHRDVLRPDSWAEIDAWLEVNLPPR